MNAALSAIPETMLIPLWAKAVETTHANPIVVDPKAAQMVEEIDYDFTQFEKARLSQVGCSVRTMLLDRTVTQWLRENKGGIIVNLGAGLDTRRERLDLSQLHRWYDLDLPEAIALRSRFFDETPKLRFVAKSVLDPTWMSDINPGNRPVLLIAEGLFMYFRESDLHPLFDRLVGDFPGAEMLFEMLAPLLVNHAQHHDAVGRTAGKAQFLWGCLDCRELESWNPKINFLKEWCYGDYHRQRWGFFGWLCRLPFLRKRINNRIVHLKFAKEAC
jgi:O-methyltransferase involved in polyketide biosynthesis